MVGELLDVDALMESVDPVLTPVTVGDTGVLSKLFKCLDLNVFQFYWCRCWTILPFIQTWCEWDGEIHKYDDGAHVFWGFEWYLSTATTTTKRAGGP